MPLDACPKCGYDARGLPGDVCPECGRRISIVPPTPVARLRWRLAIAASITAGAAALGWLAALRPEDFPIGVSPFPMTVVLPYMWTQSVPVSLAPVTLAGARLSLPVLLGRVRIPAWTFAPVFCLMALSGLNAAVGVRRGLDELGVSFVVGGCVMGAAAVVTLSALWARNRRRRGFGAVVGRHAVTALWLASYAFPYYSAFR